MGGRSGLVASPSAPIGPLGKAELAATAAAVTAAYGGALYALHRWRGHDGVPGDPAAGSGEAGGAGGNYWGTLPSAWDHPEPNYAVSAAIGEFWSVLTTIPVAGALLMHQGLKYHYGAKVLRIYALTCTMYSLAFTAHLTLQKLVFSTTVTAVMSNALLTFAEFSGVAHRALRSPLLRGSVVLVGEALLVGTVATLPYAMSANGGVWTLFVVQAPGVFLATAIATALTRRAQGEQERVVFRTVSTAGCLLSSAMALSLVECCVGFEYGYLSDWWGFPWLHIAIHVFEQVGIYIFGVGVAALHEQLFAQPPRAGSEVRYLCSVVPYLYCPYLPGGPAPTLLGQPAPSPGGGGAADAKQKAQPPAESGGGTCPSETPRGRSAAKAEGTLEAPLRRRRDQTPGPGPLAQRPPS